LKRRVYTAVALVPVLLIALYYVELATPQREYLLERPGALTRREVVVSTRAGGIRETIQLESSTGLEVDMRVLRPATATGLPVVVIVGGHRTGKDAVDLLGEPRGAAFAAIDYPYHGSHSLRGFREIVAAVPAIQRAFLDTPPALSLALDWLLEQPWVDRDRVELVGVSLGVPFAAVAGALDERFTRVWLIHGGGDNLSWVMHAGRKQIENETLRRLAARGALLIAYGNSFNTGQWIREIAPRPLVIIAARKDDRVPPAAQVPLIEAASGDSVELIWTDGQHIGHGRQYELQQLLETVLSRIE